MNDELQLKLSERATWSGSPAWGEGEERAWGRGGGRRRHRSGIRLGRCRERGVDGATAAAESSELRLRGQAENCGGTPPDPDLGGAETPCCGARGATGGFSLCFWKLSQAAL